MPQYQQASENFTLWLLLHQAEQALGILRRKELRPYNLSREESSVLFAVTILGDKATPARIARQVIRTPQSISELLVRMEKKGLVRRVNDLIKKKNIKVYLTEEGVNSFNQLIQIESLGDAMQCLSPKERHLLGESLLKLRESALKGVRKKHTSVFPESSEMLREQNGGDSVSIPIGLKNNAMSGIKSHPKHG